MVGVGCKGEAGRSPGALADPARPESLQSRGDPAHRRAGEATAALDRGEMVAEDFLNPGDAVAESLEIRFGGAGQNLHERAAADFARRVGRETAASERTLAFPLRHGRPRRAGPRSEECANPAGKFTHATTGGISVFGPLPASTAKPPRSNKRNAHARTRAAIEQARILPRVERQSGQPAKRRRDRQRQLSPGAESGVRGNGVRDDELLAGIEAKAFGDAARDMRAPLALLAQNFKAWRLAKLNAGLERVDGEANRSKPSAKISGEIEKTQMQSRRRRDLNAFQRAPLLLDSFAAYGLSEFVANIAKLCAFCQAPKATDYVMTARWRIVTGGLRRRSIATLRPPVQNATVAGEGTGGSA